MTSLLPVDVRCRFCVKVFCCKDCREQHEKNKHVSEIEFMIKQEYLQSICYMCHGMSLPYNPKEKLPEDLMNHIVEIHFPLKCDKCNKIFETPADIEQVGKCCVVVMPEPIKEEKPVEIILEEKPSRKRPPEIKINHDLNEDDVLTPLTKINLHWRRKSKEFTLKTTVEDTELSEQQRKLSTRSTSTPVPTNSTTIDSITSSLQYSSIRYNTSSENDFSPPQAAPKLPPPPVPTPKSVKKSLSQSRQKLQAQNTPLRQVMTKSIQKAIATHGHYKNMNLQQRKMSFNSSSSASETTVSLMKVNNTGDTAADESYAPLDLRTSPALKREHFSEEIGESSQQTPFINEGSGSSSATSSQFSSAVDFKYEEIQVIYTTEKSSIVTNYRSCYSESATPKIVSNNMLKKTISFEAPSTLEKTPDFLIPISKRRYSQSDDDNCCNDTVFYTPKSTPTRRTPIRRSSTPDFSTLKRDILAPSNIWKYMTSVVGSIVGTSGGSVKSEETPTVVAQSSASSSASTSSDKDKNWTSTFQKPLKAAAEYIAKATSQIDEDVRALKRRHSTTDVTSPVFSPPFLKRRRIQPRKPIRRLQSDF